MMFVHSKNYSPADSLTEPKGLVTSVQRVFSTHESALHRLIPAGYIALNNGISGPALGLLVPHEIGIHGPLK